MHSSSSSPAERLPGVDEQGSPLRDLRQSAALEECLREYQAQNPEAAAILQKASPNRLAGIAQAVGAKPVEGWFCDEARAGQKNTLIRRWAKARDHEATPSSALAFFVLAAAVILVRRLARTL